MTMQEDSTVCESIVTMPKTPYIRYILLLSSNRLDRSRESPLKSHTFSCRALSTWRISLRGLSFLTSRMTSNSALRLVMKLMRVASTSPLRSKVPWSLGSKCSLSAKTDKKSVPYLVQPSIFVPCLHHSLQRSKTSVLR